MAEISVIIPVYNAEKYLNRCIESILRQSFSDFELILIDDGSTDGSGEICDRYGRQDHRITVIRQHNHGQAAAKNAGLDEVFKSNRSQWIAFVDSDDWVHPDYLKTLCSAVKNKRTQISVCSLKTSDGTVFPEDECVNVPVQIPPEELWCRDRLAATIPVCKLFPRDLLKAFRFPEGTVHEDELSVYRVLFACDRVAYTDTPLYYYFQNPEGITLQKKWIPARADSVTAFYEQCVYFRNNGFSRAEKISAQALLCSCVEVLYHLTTEYPEEKKLIRSTRAILRQTMRRYRASLDLSEINGKKTYMRYAHPALTRINKMKKRVKRFIGRLFHA